MNALSPAFRSGSEHHTSMTVSDDLHWERVPRLMQAAIGDLRLDLAGATVLTEAGTNAYAVTPVLAALAGSAGVYALTGDSAFGAVSDVVRQVEELAVAAGVAQDRIRILTDRADVPDGIDLVTNLGFVRPVDREILGKLSPAGVVSCMYEAWELRPEDVDLQACGQMGVPVAGVWEDFEGIDVFRSCGPLAVKMCFDAGLEVAGNRIAVMSSDRFGPVIASGLRANLAEVLLVSSATELGRAGVDRLDAVVVAEYSAGTSVLDGGRELLEALQGASPGLVVVQFAGELPLDRLQALGIRVYPGIPLGPHRMMFTLAHLGPRPVVYLHAAGLKVGEVLWRGRAEQTPQAEFAALVQEVTGG